MSNEETLYARYLSGDITDKELQHLKQSGDLAKIEALMKDTKDWTLPHVNSEKGMAELEEQLHSSSSSSKSIYKFTPWTIGVAAGALLLIGFFFFQAPSEITISNPVASVTDYPFPDGSKALINAASNLSFEPSNWSSGRLVKLDGEAYFEVEKGPTFVVRTEHGEITVLGTRFNVNARENTFEVTCFEGSVAVISKSQTIQLQAEESVRLVLGQLQQNNSVDTTRPSWLEGISKFNEADLEEVFDELRRQYDVTLDVSSEIKGRFSGIFVHNDLEKAILQLSKPLGLKYTMSPDKKKVTFSR